MNQDDGGLCTFNVVDRPSKVTFGGIGPLNTQLTVAYPDLEIMEGGGGLIYLPCRLFSLLSPKIRRGPDPPIDPPLVNIRKV